MISQLQMEIWSEVCLYSAEMGLWTNGKIICMVMKTGPNELTFSYTKDWNDPDLHVALAVFSFAASNAAAEGLTIEGIIDNLCPPTSREIPNAQLGIGGQHHGGEALMADAQ